MDLSLYKPVYPLLRGLLFLDRVLRPSLFLKLRLQRFMTHLEKKICWLLLQPGFEKQDVSLSHLAHTWCSLTYWQGLWVRGIAVSDSQVWWLFAWINQKFVSEQSHVPKLIAHRPRLTQGLPDGRKVCVCFIKWRHVWPVPRSQP